MEVVQKLDDVQGQGAGARYRTACARHHHPLPSPSCPPPHPCHPRTRHDADLWFRAALRLQPLCQPLRAVGAPTGGTWGVAGSVLSGSVMPPRQHPDVTGLRQTTLKC